MAEAKDQSAAETVEVPAAKKTATKATAKRASAAKPAAKTAAKTAAKPAAKTAKATAKPTPAAKSAEPEKPAETPKSSQPAPSTAGSSTTAPSASPQVTAAPGTRITVNIPLDSAVVGVALKAATLPVSAAKKVAQNKNGIPAYVAVGGMAVIGAVEWPVAAVGGLGLAALRRWGPLKPSREQEPAKNK